MQSVRGADTTTLTSFLTFKFITAGLKRRGHLLSSIYGNKTLYCRNVEGARGQLPEDTRCVGIPTRGNFYRLLAKISTEPSE